MKNPQHKKPSIQNSGRSILSLIAVMSDQLIDYCNDLKCCGNCKKYTSLVDCPLENPENYGGRCCENWVYDEVKAEDRIK